MCVRDVVFVFLFFKGGGVIMQGHDTWMFHRDVTSGDTSSHKNRFEGPVLCLINRLCFLLTNPGAAT